EDLTLAQYIIKIMRERNLTLGTVESCTGGNLAGTITSVPGSSEIFEGTVVSYSNRIKMQVLEVKPKTLEVHGAVSEETLKEMISGGLRVLNTDYVIGTTGIMWPGGGSPEKPVGTVWIVVGNKNRTVTGKYRIPYNREKNTQMVINTALNMLRKMVLEEENEQLYANRNSNPLLLYDMIACHLQCT